MSYILESLRKADEQRQAQKVQAPETGRPAAPPGRRRKTRWLAALVIALAAHGGLALWWLQPWRTGEPGEAAGVASLAGGNDTGTSAPPARLGGAELPPAARQPVLRVSAESAGLGRDHSSAEAPALTLQAVAGNEDSEKGSSETTEQVSIPAAAARAETTAGLAAPPAGRTGAVEGRLADQNSPRPVPDAPVFKEAVKDQATAGHEVEPPTPAGGEPVEAGAVEAETPASRVAQGVTPAAAEPVATPSRNSKVPEIPAAWQAQLRPSPATLARMKQQTTEEKSIPDLVQLPAAIRQELPDLHIAAHVFSPTPASRLVSVNGRILREGQPLTGDLRVSEITDHGVIFDYRGRRFFKAVF